MGQNSLNAARLKAIPCLSLLRRQESQAGGFDECIAVHIRFLLAPVRRIGE
jgi:hypothetical protein